MATMNPIMPSQFDFNFDQKPLIDQKPILDQKPQPPPSPGVLNAVPAWGSYLYQNFLLPAFSPSEWLNNNTPNGGLNLNPTDYFGNQPNSSASTSSSTYLASIMPSRSTTSSSSQPYSAQAGPSSSSFYPQQYYNAPSAIPTSLLHTHSSSSTISPSVEVIENLIRSPSPISYEITPLPSPKRGAKRRASSMDSVEADSHDEAELHEEHDIAEGVERDGMIWGMRVEDYRALSARERKRVRNRISARTFRAKRKEHLSTLETDLSSKDLQVKAANDESARLRKQVADLTARLSKYERV